ncbi:hypothetical protein sscle_08g067310 [Sclerotinia sclerotiorum 1980 UF-70]|nr:hypothetical protein sscle_08g067310 [Sclerotinia sclerotiorum 1980 UF-70]
MSRKIQAPDDELAIFLILRVMVLVVFIWTMVVIWTNWYERRSVYLQFAHS